MRDIILFLLIITGAAVGAFLLFQVPVQKPVTQEVSEAEKSPMSSWTQEKEGIEMRVTDLEHSDDVIKLWLSLDNHQFDLSQETIYRGATLDGTLPLEYSILSSTSGGHHVEAELVFEKTDQGSFMITPVTDVVFEFNDLW